MGFGSVAILEHTQPTLLQLRRSVMTGLPYSTHLGANLPVSSSDMTAEKSKKGVE